MFDPLFISRGYNDDDHDLLSFWQPEAGLHRQCKTKLHKLPFSAAHFHCTTAQKICSACVNFFAFFLKINLRIYWIDFHQMVGI